MISAKIIKTYRNLSLFLSVSLCIYLSLSIHLSIYLAISLYLSLPLSISLYLSLSLSISLHLSISLNHSLPKWYQQKITNVNRNLALCSLIFSLYPSSALSLSLVIFLSISLSITPSLNDISKRLLSAVGPSAFKINIINQNTIKQGADPEDGDWIRVRQDQIWVPFFSVYNNKFYEQMTPEIWT